MRHLERFLLSVTVLCSLAGNAWAEHEVDHRYSIKGYILDGNERPVAGIEVRIFDGTKLLSKSRTDSAGHYSQHLHLHNEDNNRSLKIRAGSNTADLRVSFDPSDLTTQRVHHANFVGGKYIEGDLNRFRIPPWIYVLAGLVILFYIAVILEKRRKRKIRLAKMASGKIKPSKSHKSKKGRR